MRSLSVEDMRRIVTSGECFLLIDVRPLDITKVPSLPGSLRIPFGQGIAAQVHAEGGDLNLPIVVFGDGESCPIAGDAAEQLTEAGFQEVWTYSGEPEAWVRQQSSPASTPGYVVADPDAEHPSKVMHTSQA